MKLYEISIEAAAIEQLLTDAEGELTPELEQHITEFLRGGKEKLEHAACVLQSLAVQAEACRAESVRLDNRRRALERNSERLKSLMLIALDAAFGGKIKTAMFTIWGQTSAGSATFALAEGKELRDVPDWYVKFEAPHLDMGALWEAWRHKQELPKEVVVTELEGKRSLRIR